MIVATTRYITRCSVVGGDFYKTRFPFPANTGRLLFLSIKREKDCKNTVFSHFYCFLALCDSSGMLVLLK